MWQMLMVEEAIHSVAIEHAESCDCTVCQAADGDRDARERIMLYMLASRDDRFDS